MIRDPSPFELFATLLETCVRRAPLPVAKKQLLKDLIEIASEVREPERLLSVCRELLLVLPPGSPIVSELTQARNRWGPREAEPEFATFVRGFMFAGIPDMAQPCGLINAESQDDRRALAFLGSHPGFATVIAQIKKAIAIRPARSIKGSYDHDSGTILIGDQLGWNERVSTLLFELINATRFATVPGFFKYSEALVVLAHQLLPGQELTAEQSTIVEDNARAWELAEMETCKRHHEFMLQGIRQVGWEHDLDTYANFFDENGALREALALQTQHDRGHTDGYRRDILETLNQLRSDNTVKSIEEYLSGLYDTHPDWLNK
jgi:hypothetical protein